jgi:DNA helicase-2/ATP-dependent DNA helicase PcrA
MAYKKYYEDVEPIPGEVLKKAFGGAVYANDLLESLDPEQRLAVTHVGGPALVLAGAGSGKTRTITSRVAYLVNVLNIPPRRILAVTFTNKAAGEMKERLIRMLGQGGNAVGDLWVHTFHRACSRILRIEGESIGLDANFTVADQTDQVSLIKRILKQMPSPPGGITPDGWLWRIGRLKDELIRPHAFQPAGEEESFLAAVYRDYQASLAKDRLLDFDDLLLETERLFREKAEVLERWRERFSHLLVDEFQDTNTVQYLLMRMLAGAGMGLFAVGDEDQSIYRWRGAAPGNFRRFRQDYPTAKTYLLERNYRSTPVILRAAAGVIEKGTGRTPKRLRAHRAGGDRIVCRTTDTDLEEASWAAREIKGLTLARFAPEQIAVLYRMNVQSPPLERSLSALGIPYRVVGGTRFFVRQEVKDVLAYVRLAFNPDDDPSFRRAVNTPPRGIGPAALETLEQEAAGWGVSLFGAARRLAEGNLTVGRKVSPFADLVAGFAGTARELLPGEILREALRVSGYEAWLKENPQKDPEERLGNLRELERIFDNLPPSDERNPVEAFLDEVALLTDVDEAAAPAGVTLMTLHASKGLEFPVVFLVGLEEGLLPHGRALTDPDELEEERRLCYVGLTRAKDLLFLSRARQRMIYGRVVWNTPSRFLDDLPPETVLMEDGEAPPPTHKEASRRDPLQVGCQVRHPVFGVGMVLDREGSGDNLKLTVSFPASGRKKILARFLI